MQAMSVLNGEEVVELSDYGFNQEITEYKPRKHLSDGMADAESTKSNATCYFGHCEHRSIFCVNLSPPIDHHQYTNFKTGY